MSLRPRPEVANLAVCPHGGPDYAELRAMGLAPGEVLDFSVSANPFPSPPGVRRLLGTIDIERYPDTEATELRQCLAVKLGVAPGNIMAGNGAVELIRLIALTYFGHGDPVLILEPTFGEYRVACQVVGARVFSQRARAGDGFVPRIEAVVSLIRQHRPKGVFIGNPNSPTGQYLSRLEVQRVLDAVGDGLLVLDEAFIAFVDRGWSSLDLILSGNVIVVRSMTKDYSLAGLRLGYAVASEAIIRSLCRVRPPWNVNVVAQQAGVAALGEADYLEQCQKKIKEAKRFLVDELGRAGFPPMPSRVNFFLVKVGNGQRFRAALLRHGVLVRDCTSFGLPEYVRLAPRTLPECRRLIAVIHTLKSRGELEAVN